MIATVPTNFNQRRVDQTSARATLNTLQLGMAWFPEQPGGLDRYFYDLINHLPTAGVTARGLVCGSSAAENQSNGTVRAASPSNAAMPSRFLALRNSVRQDLAENKLDLIAAHFALYAWPTLSLLKSKPLVMHFHGPWYAECRMEGASRLTCWIKHRLEKSVYTRAQKLITLSEVFKNVLVNDFGIDASRVSVIPGGVDLQRFNVDESKAHARAKLAWPQDRPIVLTVRRLQKRMGLENLIGAALVAKQKHPDVLILIAGTGQLSTELQSQINSLGLANHVRLLGFLPEKDLPLAYRAADLSVVPSIALEGFGLVAVESLAAGTPALVTPVGGLPEIVRPFRNDLVAAGAGAKSLTDAILQALANRQALPTSQECRVYSQRYAWPAVTQAIREVYLSAVS